MPKTFPGEAPEPYSLNGQSGRSHTKTAPGCYVFSYWIGKPRTKGLTGEQIQAGPPLTSRRRRLSGKKTEAPDTHA